MNENNPTVPTVSEKKVGPIVATLIIVLVLIIAALYLFASKVNTTATSTNATGETTTTVSSDDPDFDSLQSDLNNSTAGLDNENF